MCIPSNTCFLGYTRVHIPNTISISSAAFCRAHDRDRPTDGQTDRPRYSVCNNRPQRSKITERFIKAGYTANLCSIDLSKALDKVNQSCLFLKLMNRLTHTCRVTALPRKLAPGIAVRVSNGITADQICLQLISVFDKGR